MNSLIAMLIGGILIAGCAGALGFVVGFQIGQKRISEIVRRMTRERAVE
jgi:hypothetical protein